MMAKKTGVRPLQPETKKRILDKWAEELKAAGLPTMEEAREKMEFLLRVPENHEQHDFVMSGFVAGSSWTPLAVIEHAISQWQEPTPGELANILKRIDGFRFEIKPIFEDAAKQLSNRLLHRLGGRPRAVKSDEHGDVCKQVSDLFRERVALKIAFQRVGKRYNVSGRTIERIWRNRPPKRD